MSELYDDEIVEAAADALCGATFGQEPPEAPIDLARAALEAAAPLIAARALHAAAEDIPGSTAPRYERIDPYDACAEWLLDRADETQEVRS